MSKYARMSPEQTFFAVFCIEALAYELNIPGDEIYKLLTDRSDILDGYILPHYEVLHTQGEPWLMRELTDLMRMRGALE